MRVLARIRFISVGILLLATGQAAAGWFGADFSADIYQGTTRQMVHQGSMAVSKGRVRTEINRNGQKMIEIIEPLQGKAWLLNPQAKEYLERPVPKSVPAGETQQNPCHGLPKTASCRRAGTEMVNGRNSDKWRLQADGHTQLLWLDSEHHFPVRVVNDGQLAMEMQFLGSTRINGRQVEKWQSQMMSPEGTTRVIQWYDPQLNIAIRQLLADGQIRELRNIRVGEQDDALFTLPDGYQRKQPQNMQTQ